MLLVRSFQVTALWRYIERCVRLFYKTELRNDAGNAVGGISFGSDGRMWFDGDMYHQGTKDSRSLRFYTSDLWCRGVFGARERSIMVVYGSYAYVYTKGADKAGTYIPLTSGTSSNNETYYIVPCYSPRYDYNGETSGFPVDTVIFRITSSATYRYLWVSPLPKGYSWLMQMTIIIMFRYMRMEQSKRWMAVLCTIVCNWQILCIRHRTLTGWEEVWCLVLQTTMIGSDYEKDKFWKNWGFVDIDKTRCSVENYKKDFANIIYQLGRGIEAHALAFKIFNSNGEIEYNDEECNMIKEYASLCSPAFIDAINKLLLE